MVDRIASIALLSEDGRGTVPTFAFGQRVRIDGRHGTEAIVQGITIFADGVMTYCVSWWSGGDLHEQSIPAYRLEAVA